jgi:RNA polymerase sigma-B factor
MLNKILFEEYFESRDIALRNKLVEENLYMVEILVKKYLGKGVDYDDLYQVGAMALISAVERFDPTKGFEFSSFATPTILGEIKKYFRDKGWSMKVPRHMKEVSSSLPRVKDELTSKLGRKPSVAEIAEAMGEKEDVILRAIESSAAYGTLSLNQTFTDNGNDGDAAMFEKYVAKNDKGFIDVENYEIINKVLDEMTGTNRYIFKKRFIEEKSQSEIAEVLGISQMSISRAEKNIIKKFAMEFAN